MSAKQREEQILKDRIAAYASGWRCGVEASDHEPQGASEDERAGFDDGCQALHNACSLRREHIENELRLARGKPIDPSEVVALAIEVRKR